MNMIIVLKPMPKASASALLFKSKVVCHELVDGRTVIADVERPYDEAGIAWHCAFLRAVDARGFTANVYGAMVQCVEVSHVLAALLAIFLEEPTDSLLGRGVARIHREFLSLEPS